VLAEACTLSLAQTTVRPASPPITIGLPDAPFKLEVFYDMQCPSCGAFHPQLKAALEKYPNKIYVTFRHFPLSMVHDKSFMASLAVEAANQQGKGYQMIDMLLSKQSEWSYTAKYQDILIRYAAELQLDVPKFRGDWLGSRMIGPVITDMERARSLNLGWTPGVYLNGKLLSFPESLEIENIISNGN
jgi:protein-disulfide isomerase